MKGGRTDRQKNEERERARTDEMQHDADEGVVLNIGAVTPGSGM